jgi:Flp pilus assembly protein TadG
MEEGTALVEFSLVLPVLLLIVMGILWFGRALNYSQDETRLTNVAARYAAVGQVPPDAGSQTLGQWLRSQADSEELRTGTGNVQGLPQVCIAYPNGTGVGSPVQVSMSATFTWLPLLNLGPSSSINGSATMRIEVPPSGSFYAAGCS